MCTARARPASLFFTDTATTEIYTLSLHDALPILGAEAEAQPGRSSVAAGAVPRQQLMRSEEDTSELPSPCKLACRLLLEKNTPRRSPSPMPRSSTGANVPDAKVRKN